MEPLVDDDIASASHLKMKASPKRRAYQQRRRTINHEPTSPVQWIFGNSITICRKVAEIRVGVSPQIVQRVLCGVCDCRIVGHRVPYNHIALTYTPISLCLRLVWRTYHFDVEGLIDRFSILNGIA